MAEPIYRTSFKEALSYYIENIGQVAPFKERVPGITQ